jgi:hypothetical protein
MKISRTFALIGIAYVVVAGSIVATQFGLSNLIEPPSPSSESSASKESENSITEEPEITKHDVWN